MLTKPLRGAQDSTVATNRETNLKGYQIFTLHADHEQRPQIKTPLRYGLDHAIKAARSLADATRADGFCIEDSNGKLRAQQYRPFI